MIQYYIIPHCINILSELQRRGGWDRSNTFKGKGIAGKGWVSGTLFLYDANGSIANSISQCLAVLCRTKRAPATFQGRGQPSRCCFTMRSSWHALVAAASRTLAQATGSCARKIRHTCLEQSATTLRATCSRRKIIFAKNLDCAQTGERLTFP